MTLLELWEQAKKDDATVLWAFIEFLVFEKKKESRLTFMSDAKELDFYYQDRFRDKMNIYLKEYMRRRGLTSPPYNEEEHKKVLAELEQVNALITMFEIIQKCREKAEVYA